MPVSLNHNKIGQLETVTVTSDRYRAVVLLQGAQLLHFMTTREDDEHKAQKATHDFSDNWLWVSDEAEYKRGQSVRGGVPICWPVFGQFTANPQAVKDSFVHSPFDLSQHGYARSQPFVVDSCHASVDHTQLVLILNEKTVNQQTANQKMDSQPTTPTLHLDLKVVLDFSADGFAIRLITQNNAKQTVTFSQALHTYLPTDDITQTSITGFDGVTYSDTLTTDSETGNWQTMTQHGDITVESEVDRIYHAAPTLLLNTPAHIYTLTASGSNSTVVWNPWIKKSKQISQFADSDYQKMLCIETANAHLDVVELAPGQVWEMGVQVRRQAV